MTEADKDTVERVEQDIAAYLKGLAEISANSGSAFNQGVVRGLEIAAAQFEHGHARNYIPAIAAMPATHGDDGDEAYEPDPIIAEYEEMVARHAREAAEQNELGRLRAFAESLAGRDDSIGDDARAALKSRQAIGENENG